MYLWKVMQDTSMVGLKKEEVGGGSKGREHREQNLRLRAFEGHMETYYYRSF